MTSEIKRVIEHVLNVSQRMLIRELPLISAAIRKINVWLAGIDYRQVRHMGESERRKYDRKKIRELKKEIDEIEKGE